MIKKATIKEKQYLKEISLALKELIPEAKIELDYENEFQLLIAILMSAQTTDIQVNKVNQEFFKHFQTPKDILNLWEAKIKKMISSIWLYNTKAKNIYQTAQLLDSHYQNTIPETLDELTKLPWVGIKTAKVWLAVVKWEPYLAVDTHVHRVLNRLWVVKTKTPKETDRVMSQKFDWEDVRDLHHRLVLYGRYFCTARNPKCSETIMGEFCKH